ncbi:MAG TPA: hypothetical protein VF014_12515 [Casimicrobiaceae bacterium]|nr:hypothetical protein [Casimicrobiaceae bacterium]
MAMERKLLGAAPLMFLASACFAGPCTSEIDRMQVLVDARIEAIAKGGRLGKESSAAQLDRQPTPGSIAAAEAKLGEGKAMEHAVEALARARTADGAGDKRACERALADVQRAIGP